MNDAPTWFQLGDQLLWPLIGMGMAATRECTELPIDLQPLGYNALIHHAGCLQSSMMANEKGKHSAAVCLIRQCVEALTVAEIGLQPPEFAQPLLEGWKSGKKTQGNLRKSLEEAIWPRYGSGLWNEPWAEFYGNLAKAVQPYAHYTTELEGWLYAVIDHDGGSEFTAMVGLETYDPLQATRITLFHMLLTWMLGRILLAHGQNEDILSRKTQISELGQALAASKLLFEKGEWWSQLAPHMLFKPGVDWRDDA